MVIGVLFFFALIIGIGYGALGAPIWLIVFCELLILATAIAIGAYIQRRRLRKKINIKKEKKNQIIITIDKFLGDKSAVITTKGRFGGMMDAIESIREQMLEYFSDDNLKRQKIGRICNSKNKRDVRVQDILLRLKNLLDPKVDIGNVNYGGNAEEYSDTGGGLFD